MVGLTNFTAEREPGLVRFAVRRRGVIEDSGGRTVALRFGSSWYAKTYFWIPVSGGRVGVGHHHFLPWPRVDSGHLEAVVPRAGVGALSLRPRAHAVAVRLAVLPTAAVRPSVVEVEPAPVHVALGGGGARGSGGRRGGRRLLGRTRLLHGDVGATRSGDRDGDDGDDAHCAT